MKITQWKNIKLYRDILSVRRDLDEVNIEREILKIKLNETQIERSLTKPKSPHVKSDDRRSKEYEKEPKEFQFLIKIPSVFSINAFNFTPATVHLNTECDCVEGKERFLTSTVKIEIKVADIKVTVIFKRPMTVENGRSINSDWVRSKVDGPLKIIYFK